jgi:tRNA A64-2'-O-ribosylphosphate transferase
LAQIAIAFRKIKHQLRKDESLSGELVQTEQTPHKLGCNLSLVPSSTFSSQHHKQDNSMPGPTTSDLIFSEQANHNFSKALGELKRSALSIHNRLRSIQEDAAFAQKIATAYGRPLIANERCGSWYIDPHTKAGSVYFKSTDGHTGVWKFSSRRLNLHLLDIIGKNDGLAAIDGGRSMLINRTDA